MSVFTNSWKQLRSHPLSQQVQQRWQQLNQREQRLLKALGTVVLLAILYWLIWQPSHQARIQAQLKLEAQQQQLAWVKQAIARYQALSEEQQQPAAEAGGSLTQRLNQAAAANDIELARIQPQGDGIMIAVDEANFDQVLNFVGQLESQYQLTVETLDIARLDRPGQVRVRQLMVIEKV